MILYQRSKRKSSDRSLKTLRKIGLALIARAQRFLSTSKGSADEIDFREHNQNNNLEDTDDHDTLMFDGQKNFKLKGRDILSLLSEHSDTVKDKPYSYKSSQVEYDYKSERTDDRRRSAFANIDLHGRRS